MRMSLSSSWGNGRHKEDTGSTTFTWSGDCTKAAGVRRHVVEHSRVLAYDGHFMQPTARPTENKPHKLRSAALRKRRGLAKELCRTQQPKMWRRVTSSLELEFPEGSARRGRETGPHQERRLGLGKTGTATRPHQDPLLGLPRDNGPVPPVQPTGHPLTQGLQSPEEP